MAAGFLSLAGLVGRTAAVAAAAPAQWHEGPQAQWGEGPQATMVEHGVLAAAPSSIYGGAQPGSMVGDAQPDTAYQG